MTTVIKTKNSTTTTSAPSSLAQGELAVNITDKKLWVGNAATTPIQLLGAGADLSLSTATLSGNLTLSGGTANGVLYLNGSKVATSGSALVFDGTNFATTGTISGTNHIVTGGTANGNSMYLATTNSIGWSTNGTERMRVDSSGNLGLGVTPNTWLSGLNVYQTGHYSAYSGKQGQVLGSGITNNTYYNGSNWVYQTSDVVGASRYEFDLSHRWFTAPSGTAGNTATFTQAMTLNANANLSVGLTGANARLNLLADNAIEIYNSTATNVSNIDFPDAQTLRIRSYHGSGSNITFGTAPSGGANTERARIDSSGNLLVANTGSVTSGGHILAPNSGNSIYYMGHITGSSAGSGYFSFQYNGTQIGSISQVLTTGVAYNVSSDYRLKNNQKPIIDSGSFIDSLKPKSWDWCDGNGSSMGFIAHEFAETCPNYVVGEKDAVDEEGKPKYQSIDSSNPEMMANIVAELQSLRKRVAQLEGK